MTGNLGQVEADWLRQSQPPGRLKEGRVVNPPEAAPTVTHCRKRFYVHQRMFVDGNIFPAIAVGRLEWSFRFLAGNDQKERKTGS